MKRIAGEGPGSDQALVPSLANPRPNPNPIPRPIPRLRHLMSGWLSSRGPRGKGSDYHIVEKVVERERNRNQGKEK